MVTTCARGRLGNSLGVLFVWPFGFPWKTERIFFFPTFTHFSNPIHQNPLLSGISRIASWPRLLSAQFALQPKTASLFCVSFFYSLYLIQRVIFSFSLKQSPRGTILSPSPLSSLSGLFLFATQTPKSNRG